MKHFRLCCVVAIVIFGSTQLANAQVNLYAALGAQHTTYVMMTLIKEKTLAQHQLLYTEVTSEAFEQFKLESGLGKPKSDQMEELGNYYTKEGIYKYENARVIFTLTYDFRTRTLTVLPEQQDPSHGVLPPHSLTPIAVNILTPEERVGEERVVEEIERFKKYIHYFSGDRITVNVANEEAHAGFVDGEPNLLVASTSEGAAKQIIALINSQHMEELGNFFASHPDFGKFWHLSHVEMKGLELTYVEKLKTVLQDEEMVRIVSKTLTQIAILPTLSFDTAMAREIFLKQESLRQDAFKKDPQKISEMLAITRKMKAMMKSSSELYLDLAHVGISMFDGNGTYSAAKSIIVKALKREGVCCARDFTKNPITLLLATAGYADSRDIERSVGIFLSRMEENGITIRVIKMYDAGVDQSGKFIKQMNALGTEEKKRKIKQKWKMAIAIVKAQNILKRYLSETIRSSSIPHPYEIGEGAAEEEISLVDNIHKSIAPLVHAVDIVILAAGREAALLTVLPPFFPGKPIYSVPTTELLASFNFGGTGSNLSSIVSCAAGNLTFPPTFMRPYLMDHALSNEIGKYKLEQEK